MKDKNFPDNIINELGLHGTQLPEDFIPTLYYLAGQNNPRGPTIIALRYQMGMTREEIGKLFKVTRERIRQLEHKVIRNLKSPENTEILTLGIKEHYENMKEHYSIRNEQLEHEVRLYGKEPYDVLNTPIHRIGFSTKTYNTLSRACIHTIRDIMDAGPQNILRIRNCGEKMFDEIAGMLTNNFGQDKSVWNIDYAKGRR